MKKLITWLLALLMLGSSVAFAEMPEFSAMTDEELHAIINGARNELKIRELAAEKDTILMDREGVKVYLTGKNEVEEYSSGNVYLKLEVVVVNDRDNTISVLLDSATVNGWDVYGSGISEITAGHKKKGNLELTISEAEISKYEEIEDSELVLLVYNSDDWETVFKDDPVTLHFN